MQKAQALLFAALACACSDDGASEALRESVLYTAPDDRDVTELFASTHHLVLRAEDRSLEGSEVFTVMDHQGENARDVLLTSADEAIVDARTHGDALYVLTSTQLKDKRDRPMSGYRAVLHRVTLDTAELESTELDLETVQLGDEASEMGAENQQPVRLAPCGLGISAWGVVVKTAQHVWRIDESDASLVYGQNPHGTGSEAGLCDGVLSDDGKLVSFGDDVFSDVPADAAWVDVVDLEQGMRTRHAHGLDTPWTHLDREPVFGADGKLIGLAIPDQRPSDSPYRFGQLLRFDPATGRAEWLTWEVPALPDQLVPALGGLVVSHSFVRDDVPTDDLYAYDMASGRARFVVRTELHGSRPFARTLAGSPQALFFLRSNARERGKGEPLSYRVTSVEP